MAARDTPPDGGETPDGVETSDRFGADPAPPTTGLPLPALPESGQVIDAMVGTYPAKVARLRRTHMTVNDPRHPPAIAANSQTIPGIITQRGCCYAGCKGVVLGPITDVLHIVHGPIGCAYYAWMTRRNQATPPPGTHNYLHYCFSTDMTENEIIFGGEQKLAQAIREAFDLFHPTAIAVYSTCPVGLIGDDVHAVAKQARQELGINVFAMSCEGYRGVSQSLGHHIANNALFTEVVGTEDVPAAARGHEFRINLLGEYNIGGDAFEIQRVLDRCGIELVSTFSGNVHYSQIARSHTANLNAVMCHRSVNYMASMMETRYGIPWIKVNFIGSEATAKSLRKIARYFEDPGLTERVERVIADELAGVVERRESYRARCAGKLAMLYVGGSRSHHYQELFRELGMPTVSAGYEFAHHEDYAGQRAAAATTGRGVEDLPVAPDPVAYRRRKDDQQLADLAADGLRTGAFPGLMQEMAAGAMVVDDISHHELETLIRTYRPAVVCSGIKDKYVVEKMGVPCKQLHNYDYGGPYAGFRGALNFYRDIDRMVNAMVWRFVTPPWAADPRSPQAAGGQPDGDQLPCSTTPARTPRSAPR